MSSKFPLRNLILHAKNSFLKSSSAGTMWEVSILFPKFCCEPKTAHKKKKILKNKTNPGEELPLSQHSLLAAHCPQLGHVAIHSCIGDQEM